MKAGSGIAGLRKEVRRRLEALSDPDVRSSMERLVPDTKMLGVRVPQIKFLAAEWAKEHPMDFDATIDFFDALCEAGLREEILVGIFLLARHKKRLREIRWAAVDGWLDHIDNWETCDQLASNVVAPAVAANPGLRPPLRALTRAANIWRKRFAVATGAALNQRGRFVPELTLEICQDLMEDENAAIRKAVGWAIRELSKKDEEIAFAFLMENRGRIARSLMREASEKLIAARRAQLLA
jgi:3-methyladenine DNA glycosylase AlkD